jgi:PIN domain nuclease of toxin-antitoxin system
MAIKFSLHKLNLGQQFEDLFPQQLDLNSIEIMSINIDHLKVICNLPFHHRDPFDRIIAAQALFEQLPVISKDSILDNYGIIREW